MPSAFCWTDCQGQIFTFDSSTVFFNFLADPCYHYQSLSDASRKSSYTTPPSQEVCDKLPKGWYRFVGAAGTKMPTTRVPEFRCGTAYSGWLMTAHPTVEDGEALGEVCFTAKRGPGCKKTETISIQNCGSYFIYKLGDPPLCSMRYCGTDWAKQKKKRQNKKAKTRKTTTRLKLTLNWSTRQDRFHIYVFAIGLVVNDKSLLSAKQYWLRGVVNNFQEFGDRSKNSTFFLFAPKDPFGELFSKITFKSSSELLFWQKVRKFEIGQNLIPNLHNFCRAFSAFLQRSFRTTNNYLGFIFSYVVFLPLE